MPDTQLLELASGGKLDAFETRVLELLENRSLTIAELVVPLRQFERGSEPTRMVALAQMILDNADSAHDPGAAISILRTTLNVATDNADLRKRLADLYARQHAGEPNFANVLSASGLTTNRQLRPALKLIDLYEKLRPGAVLIGRMDDKVVEVTEFDRSSGLVTIKRERGSGTLPLVELAREYDPIDENDFRVLRTKPERLQKMIDDDPVGVVVGLLHAHRESLSVDDLKSELSPRYIPAADWSKWWSKARTVLKKSRNVAVEGRSPVILRYIEQAATLEDDAWARFEAVRDALKWQAAVETYLKEKNEHGQTPDPGLLQRFQTHIVAYINAIRGKRPAEALACALVLEALSQRGLPIDEATRSLAVQMLREARDAGRLIGELEHDDLWSAALPALRSARPEDWHAHVVGLIPRASAALLDELIGAALEAGFHSSVQEIIDKALTEPARYAEVVYWMWKGPKKADGLRLPAWADLFALILNSLSSLGRTVSADADVVKNFRARARAALALRDYARFREVVSQTSEAAAITIRRQLDRLEGLGDNARIRMLDLLRDVHPQLWVDRRARIEPWEDQTVVYCTQEGLRRRTAERDHLMNVEMRDNARRIGEAAALGDLSENSEYKFALEERDLLRARLARMNDELSRAATISVPDVSTDHVSIGTRVGLRDTADGSERSVTLLGPFEGDVEKNIYSYQAPFSQKLMGLQVGQRARVQVHGQEHELEVVSIENALDGGSRG